MRLIDADSLKAKFKDPVIMAFVKETIDNEPTVEIGRALPKVDYTCAISKRACTFNDDFWESFFARDAAHDNCPIQAYENNDHLRE